MEGSESEAVFNSLNLNPQLFINETLNTVDDLVDEAFNFYLQYSLSPLLFLFLFQIPFLCHFFIFNSVFLKKNWLGIVLPLFMQAGIDPFENRGHG